MLNLHSKLTSKYIFFLIFNLTLFSSLLCFSQPVIGNYNSKVLKLIQERDRLLQQVYLLNTLKIRSISNKINLCMAKEKGDFTLLKDFLKDCLKDCPECFENRLTTFFIYIPQPTLVNPERIRNFLQQRLELLNEALILARIRYKIGIGTLEDIGWFITPEMVKVRLRMIDIFKVKDSKEKRAEIYKGILEESSQTEREAKLLEQVGLGTIFDVLLAESWRLDIQIQSGLVNPGEIRNLLQKREKSLIEALRLSRLKYQAGVGTLEDIGWIMAEILEVRLKMIDVFEMQDPEKISIEVYKAALAQALYTESVVKLLEQAGLETKWNTLVAENWRLDIQIQTTLPNPEEVRNLLQQRLELLNKTLRLARIRYLNEVGTLEDIILTTSEILEVRFKMIDVFEVKDPEKVRIEVYKAALEEALKTENDAKLFEQTGLETKLYTLAAKSWRLDIQIQLECEEEKVALSRDTCKCDSFWRNPDDGGIPGFSKVTKKLVEYAL